jgi:hypothetical protein
LAALTTADAPVELVPWGAGVAAELVAEAAGAVVLTVLVTEAVLDPPLDPHAPTAAASSDAVTAAAAHLDPLPVIMPPSSPRPAAGYVSMKCDARRVLK